MWVISKVTSSTQALHQTEFKETILKRVMSQPETILTLHLSLRPHQSLYIGPMIAIVPIGQV